MGNTLSKVTPQSPEKVGESPTLLSWCHIHSVTLPLRVAVSMPPTATLTCFPALPSTRQATPQPPSAPTLPHLIHSLQQMAPAITCSFCTAPTLSG